MPETRNAAGLEWLTVGNVDCRTVKDAHFKLIRQVSGIPDDFLSETFDFGKLSCGGGKGGDVMARSSDGKYFVKQLNDGDAHSLLRDEFLSEYVSLVSGASDELFLISVNCFVSTKYGYVTTLRDLHATFFCQGSTLICKIAAVFEHTTLGTFIAMANCLPAYINSWSGLYDLKGSADDKILIEDGVQVPEAHKRFWNIDLVVCEATGCNKGVPFARKQYVKGKRQAYDTPIYVTKEQKAYILNLMQQDVAFFTRFGLMDYSMIVGVYRPPPGFTQHALEHSFSHLHSIPHASHYKGDMTVLFVGIIDFLQAWTRSKRCAHLVKACCAPPPISTIPPSQYAAQFMQFFQWKFRGVAHPLCPISANPLENSHGPKESEQRNLEIELQKLKLMIASLVEKLTASEARVAQLESCLI